VAKIILYEQGSSGLKQYSGFVSEAYHRSLTWPSVQPLYSRLRRSDPEIAAIRYCFTALARSCSFRWELPDDPSDGDRLAQEFAETVLSDIEGGIGGFIESMVSNVPFFGWGWWEVVPGYRSPTWSPPDPNDDWRSNYDDGRIGIRRLAWRDSSSFSRWDLDPATGRLLGMVQQAYPHPPVTLPLADSLHLVFGDAHNPEGLSPLEAVWRLERIKYGLEVVQGIGFEHSAGYLDVTVDKALDKGVDNPQIAKAARAIMSAQEGNYAAWPAGVTGELKDVNFAAAPSILEAIKYFGVQKLTLYLMQWVALSAQTGTGSNAAMQDSSSMFIQTYNAMLEGFATQIDNQIGKRLFKWNSIPGMTRRPVLKVDPITKISLDVLASILPALKNVMPLGEEDYKAIRKQSVFLPNALPDDAAEVTPPAPAAPGDGLDETEGDNDPGNPDPGNPDPEELAAQKHYRDYIKVHPEALYGRR
jgi:hypothetical protein